MRPDGTAAVGRKCIYHSGSEWSNGVVVTILWAVWAEELKCTICLIEGVGYSRGRGHGIVWRDQVFLDLLEALP